MIRTAREICGAFHEMTLDDLDDKSARLGDPEVMRFYDRPKARKEAEAWIEWNQRLYAVHGYGLWLLRLRETAPSSATAAA